MLADSIPTRTDVEFELLLAACRTGDSAHRLDGWISRSKDTDIDWEWVLQFAARHKLMPLLHHHLSCRYPSAAPASWMRRLGNRVFANRTRCEQLARELVDIQQILRQAGIDSLAFKGTVLAERIYRDIGLRQGWDIDLLVRQKDFTSAIEIFNRAGYQVVRCHDQAVDLLNRTTGTPVDLHWCLTPKYFPYRENIEDFFSRSIRFQSQAGSVTTLDDEDLVAVLCLQVCKDAWERQQRIPYFFKVVDLAASVNALRDLDWGHLRDRARRNGWLKIMLIAMEIADQQLDCQLKDLRKTLGTPSKSLQRWTARLGQDVFLRDLPNAPNSPAQDSHKRSIHPKERLKQGLFFMRIRERPIDWMHYIYAATLYGIPELLFGKQSPMEQRYADLSKGSLKKV